MLGEPSYHFFIIQQEVDLSIAQDYVPSRFQGNVVDHNGYSFYHPGNLNWTLTIINVVIKGEK